MSEIPTWIVQVLCLPSGIVAGQVCIGIYLGIRGAKLRKQCRLAFPEENSATEGKDDE